MARSSRGSIDADYLASLALRSHSPALMWTGKLSEAELSAAVYYVRGFYGPDDSKSE